MVVIFAAVASSARQMLLGETAGSGAVELTPRSVAVPLVSALVACAFFGVIAWPLQPLLHAAAHVVAP
jgi:formate hydrogenlyase subunit 3/multisubunit Na+/H+ antiporter MnhD subunit